MTTTEWVGRYNRAFEEAGSEELSYESTPCDAEFPYPTIKEMSKILYNDPCSKLLSWTAPETGKYSINGEVVYLTKGEQRLFVANYRPSEPKEVVDDTPKPQNGLNQKESSLSTWTANTQGWYWVGGLSAKRVWLEKGQTYLPATMTQISEAENENNS